MEIVLSINMKLFSLWVEGLLDKYSKLEKLIVKINFLTMQ
jgi:hypothetical protein